VTTLLKILPLAYLLLAIAIAAALDAFAPVLTLLPHPWNLLGIAPAALGAALVLTAGLSLKQHRTAIKPLKRPKALVTTGVFAISRNPIYLGFVLILLGTALLLGTLTPHAVVLPLAAFLDALFIRYEEKRLEEAFGDAWRGYRRAVRRWL